MIKVIRTYVRAVIFCNLDNPLRPPTHPPSLFIFCKPPQPRPQPQKKPVKNARGESYRGARGGACVIKVIRTLDNPLLTPTHPPTQPFQFFAIPPSLQPPKTCKKIAKASAGAPACSKVEDIMICPFPFSYQIMSSHRCVVHAWFSSAP